MPRAQLSVVGLFAGVGGLELGLQRAGHHAVQLWELLPEARACLAVHFPDADVPDPGDITVDGFRERLPEQFDLLAAGFPCQDLSQAGTGAGIHGERSGLILDVFDALSAREADTRPPWIVLENVKNMRHLAQGEAMQVVLDRLRDLGYSWAYREVDSNSFGLPQRRKRLYIVACRPGAGDPRSALFANDAKRPKAARAPAWEEGIACGFYWTEGNRGLGWGHDVVPALKVGSSVRVPSPPAIVHPEEGIVRPSIEDAEALQGFPRGWTAPAAAVVGGGGERGRWRLVGNAVSVPVARWLGEQLAEPRKPLPKLVARAGKQAADEGWPGAAFRMLDDESVRAVRAKDWPADAALLDELDLEPQTLTALLGVGQPDSREPLSLRATRGFRERFERSSLLERSSPALRQALIDRLLAHEESVAGP